jgi:uncharacterized protein (DUF305 family)
MTSLVRPRRARVQTRLAAGLLVAAAALSGCGGDTSPMAGHMDDHMTGDATSGNVSTDAGRPGHGMMTSVRDEADYLVTMVAHHREAIVAARSLTRSGHPELRRLGRDIRRAQSQQVRMMERWLDRWYPRATPSTDYQPMMSDLTSLTGDDLDRTFLAEMIHHHMMAVMMSRQLVRSGLVRHQAVAGLAESVIDDQTAEIVLMRQWLREWD